MCLATLTFYIDTGGGLLLISNNLLYIDSNWIRSILIDQRSVKGSSLGKRLNFRGIMRLTFPSITSIK